MNGSIIRPGTTPLNALQAVPPGAVVCNPTGSSAIPTACTSLPPAAIPPPTGATLGGVTSNTPASHQFATGINTSGAVTTAQPAATDVSGLAPSATTDTTNAGNISSGTLSSGRLPALAGDVTSSAGSATTTIATGAVTDTKASLANKPSVGLVATSNLALSGVQTIDGVTGTAGVTLVLATAQSTASQNGPWLMQSGAWTRPTWYPSGGTTQAIQFSEIKVRLGNTYQNSTWRLTTAAPITIDTTAQAWAVTPYNLNANTVTGTLPLGQLPFTGSPGATTFARGDGTWSSIYVNPSTLVSGQLKITTTGTAVCPPSAALSSG
ncbi:MAG TPA: hypothetical protein VFA75_05315, partial [Nevskia sp.]|nr:hypothetical protein [Nevskia sp.]